MVYLDNAATTQVKDSAIEAAVLAMRDGFGNPSSLHTLGIEAEKVVRTAREIIAEKIGADKNEIIFTSGGTEGNNTAIFGVAEAKGKRGKHIITSAVEHASVLNPMKKLSEQGFEITYLKHEELNPDGVLAHLRADTIFVSIMTVNNEIGAIYPTFDIARAVKRVNKDVIVHTDAVQAFLKVPINLRKSDIDLLTISGHKVHAPKGIGALYIKKGVRIKARNIGGGQERELRSGTENVPGIAAFGVAVSEEEKFGNTLSYLKEKLKDCDKVKILYDAEAPHILSIAIPTFPSEVAMRMLEKRGIYVSSGSACSKGHRSHVLEAMKIDSKLIDSAIRISICASTTKEEIDEFILAVNELF